MKNPCLGLLLFFITGLSSCSQEKNLQLNTLKVTPVAFPGAEGFGKFATGGRGGSVYKVSNLNDEGEGSLRWALNKSGPRIIVFDVSGTIHLLSPLNVKENTTIAGQSAPGDGISIADHPVKIDGNNVIIRYMRFRMGDRYQNKGMVPGSGHDDALSATGKKNLIIDHCSISWSTDELFSVYNGDSTTLQWNLIAEPLDYSYHFEAGDTDFERHGYGGIWGGRHLSAHHNLFAHCNSRNPRFAGIRNVSEEMVDYRNNVIYNWGNNNVYGGEGGHYNIVNNYYKYGPTTKASVKYRVANPSKQVSPFIPYGKYFIEGNYVDGSADITADNWKGVTMGSGTENDKAEARRLTAFEAVAIKNQSAPDAYQAILDKVGASLKRDTLDQRVIGNVINRTGKIIDVQGGFPHGTPYPQTMNAWPVLKSLPAPKDTDGDGMPDEWEKQNGLDPYKPGDASLASLHLFYTNIEVYLNSLVSE